MPFLFVNQKNAFSNDALSKITPQNREKKLVPLLVKAR